MNAAGNMKPQPEPTPATAKLENAVGGALTRFLLTGLTNVSPTGKPRS